AFTELPLFFAGGYILKKFGDYKLMVFGTFMYIVRFILYAVVQSPELLIAVSLLQCVTYPLIMITSKTLVDDTTPVELRASGQTIASAFYVGVSLLIAPIMSGFLANAFGLDMTLLIIGLTGILALMLCSVYKKI
ncbi:MAG: MFS transporter, partial [Longicatena sp.]